MVRSALLRRKAVIGTPLSGGPANRRLWGPANGRLRGPASRRLWGSAKRRACGIPLLAASAAIVAAGCATEPQAPQSIEPTITTVDGVRVVDNHAPVWPDGEGWRISEQPMLTLGVESGEPYEMFSYLDAARLANGAIVVGDRGSQEVRAFDENGNHLWTAGGSGQGPGEFDYLAYVLPSADSRIVVFDGRNFRLTMFASDGALVETFELAEQGDERYNARSSVEDVFPDGSLLTLASSRLNRETFAWEGIGPGERGWVSGGAFRYSADGSEYTLIAEIDRWEVGQSEGFPVPFQARGFVRPHSRGIYYANGRSSEIEDHGLDGTLRASFRMPLDPISVTPEARERWLQKSLDNYAEAGFELQPERRDGMVFPDTMPTRRNLLVDREDNVWAERFLGLQHSRPLYWGFDRNSDPFFPETESLWDVFTPEGVWLGDVELVPGRTIEQIGDDWVLMSGEDDAGVHRVWLYELIKGPNPE